MTSLTTTQPVDLGPARRVIAANKVPGVRAALCTDAETARGARRWNDANVLAFGLRLTTAAVAEELLDGVVRLFRDGSPENLDERSQDIAHDVEATWLELERRRLVPDRPAIAAARRR